jgi:hypothetical protein
MIITTKEYCHSWAESMTGVYSNGSLLLFGD